MVYTLNGVGPLRGLPSLSMFIDELGEVGETLARVRKATDTLGMKPGKRIIALRMGRAGEGKLVQISQFIRGLKSSGFTVYGIFPEAPWYPLAGIDYTILYTNSPEWPNIAGNAFVYEPEDEDIPEPEFIQELAGMPKYLLVDKVNAKVAKFIRDSNYLWSVQLPSAILEVDV